MEHWSHEGDLLWPVWRLGPQSVREGQVGTVYGVCLASSLSCLGTVWEASRSRDNLGLTGKSLKTVS